MTTSLNVSLIAQKFLEMLRKLREMDFRISGKVVLACAIMLKLKSNKLVEEDIFALDSLMSSSEDAGELLDELPLENGYSRREKPSVPGLTPRTPQPRKRKVSVYDLVQALTKALEVENRRPVYVKPTTKIRVPENFVDMGELIQDVFQQIETYYNKPEEKKFQNKNVSRLSFSQLVPSESKTDKVFTFIPLLHLETQLKIGMSQEEHFGEIEIELSNNGMISLETIQKDPSQE